MCKQRGYRNHRLWISLWGLIGLFLFSNIQYAQAQTTNPISVQGVLRDANGDLYSYEASGLTIKFYHATLASAGGGDAPSTAVTALSIKTGAFGLSLVPASGTITKMASDPTGWSIRITGVLKNDAPSGTFIIPLSSTPFSKVAEVAATLGNTQAAGESVIAAVNNASTTGTLSPLRLGTGTPDGSKFLRDDGTWASPSASIGGSAGGDLTGTYPNPTLTTSGVTAGTYPKVTVDAKGRVTVGAALAATDIPNLDAAKVTSGVFGTARLGTGTADNTVFLRGDGTWTAPTATAGGSAGGDLTGTYPNPSIGTGKVTSTHILNGEIVNDDINASAGIVDTKLATIATAGKVSNSATTAASANTASAIVARDASGNFSAGTVTAKYISSSQDALVLNPSGTGTGETGEIHFGDLAAGAQYYAKVKAPDTLTGNYTLTLPTAVEAGKLLTTNASGQLSWTTAGGSGAVTGAAGNTTNIQYNNAGAFAGSDSFTWNDTTKLLNVTGDLQVEKNSTGKGLKLGDSVSASSKYVTLKAPDLTSGASYSLTLPTSVEASKLLTTDASGNLSWTTVAASGGVTGPAGNTKEVQFNDGGTMAGAAGLYWDKVNSRVGIGDSTPATALEVNGTITGNDYATTTGTFTFASPYAATLNVTSAQAGQSALFSATAPNGKVFYMQSGESLATIATQPGIPLALTVANTERVRIDTSGNMSVASSGDLSLTDGSMKFGDTGGGTNYVTLKAPADADLTTDYSLTLPVDDGTSGQVLRTDGSGVLSWATPTAGVAGSDKQVQFNNGGSLAGATNMIWDTTNSRLGLGAATAPSETLDVTGNVKASGTMLGTGGLRLGASTNIQVGGWGTIDFGGGGGGAQTLAFNGFNDGINFNNSVNFANGKKVNGPSGSSYIQFNSTAGANSTPAMLMVGSQGNDAGNPIFRFWDPSAYTEHNVFGIGGGTTYAEYFTVNGNGNVGIGVSSAPASKLTVSGGEIANIDHGMKFGDTGGGANYVTLKAPADADLTTDYSLTLPVDDGTSGQVLRTDGSGVLSWVTPTAGVAGSDKQVQFNDGGSLAGAALLGWDKTNSRLGVGTLSPSVGLHVVNTTSGAAAVRAVDSSAGNDGHAFEAYNINNGGYVLNCVGCANNPAVNLVSTNSNGGRIILGSSTKSWDLISQTNDLNITELGSGSRLFLKSGGNVGIGSTSPGSKLEVSGGEIANVDHGVKFGDTGGGTNYVTLKAPADASLTADYTLTLPTALGSANQVLKTDASGQLSWTDLSVGGGSVSGLTNTLITYGNASGNLAQSADFIWNDTSKYLQIGRDANYKTKIVGNYNGSAGAIEIGAAGNSAAQGGIAIGFNTTASAGSGIAIGSGVTSAGIGIGGNAGSGSVAIGGPAAGDNAVAIGPNSTASGAQSFASGLNATASHTNSVVFGRDASSSANNQVVFGGPAGGNAGTFSEVYFGSGPKNTAVSIDYTIFGSSSVTTSNLAGGSLNLSGGKSTGSAAGGSVNLQTTAAGGAGATQNTPTTILTVNANGNVGIGNGSNTPGSKLEVTGGEISNVNHGVKFGDTGGGTNYVTVRAPADADLTGDYTLTLPTALGSANQVLKTDASGQLSWTDLSVGGGSVSGLTQGQVQFGNASGNLAGSNSLFWDITNSRLGIGTATPAHLLDMVSASTSVLRLKTDSGAAPQILLDNATQAWTLANRGSVGNNFQVLSGASSVFDITTAGNVGIGTASPASKLVVSDTAGSATAMVIGGGYNQKALSIYHQAVSGTPTFSIEANDGSLVSYGGLRVAKGLALTDGSSVIRTGINSIATDSVLVYPQSFNTGVNLDLSTANGSTPTGVPKLRFGSNGGSSAGTAFTEVGSFRYDVNSGKMSLYQSADSVNLVAPVEVMTWDGSNARVGIGTASPSTKLDVAGAIRTNTSLVVEEPDAGTNTVTIAASATTGTYSLTLPVDDGAAGQALVTDGTGVLSWTSLGGGSISGLTQGQVQFGNASGNLAGSNSLFWDITNSRLGIGTASPASAIEVNPAAAATVGQIIKGAASQSADFLQLKNNAGTTLASVDKDGTLNAYGATFSGKQYAYAHEGVRLVPSTLAPVPMGGGMAFYNSLQTDIDAGNWGKIRYGYNNGPYNLTIASESAGTGYAPSLYISAPTFINAVSGSFYFGNGSSGNQNQLIVSNTSATATNDTYSVYTNQVAANATRPHMNLGAQTLTFNTGTTSLAAAMSISSASDVSIEKSVKLGDTGGGTNYVTVQAPANADLTADYTLTLPVNDGDANQVLKTDGSGVLSWTSISGALSGLTTGKIPYATSSSSLADSGLSWDGVSSTLSMAGVIYSSGTTGATPASGAGTRFMWIPAKGAIRAGAVTGTEWDDANIGTNSIAMGYNSKASSANAVAIGSTNVVSGTQVAAVGYNNTISGGDYSYAFGATNAIGASVDYSAGVGYSNTLSGDYSYVLGSNNTVTGATALGYGHTAAGSRSVAIGFYNYTNGYTSTAIGRYNINVASQTSGSIVDTDVMFSVGNGTAAGDRSDALRLDGNGVLSLLGKQQASDLAKGSLRIYEAPTVAQTVPVDYVAIQSPTTLAAAYTLTLPVDDGTANQVLTTDGTGGLSWTTPSGGGSVMNIDNLPAFTSGAITDAGLNITVSSTNYRLLHANSQTGASIYLGKGAGPSTLNNNDYNVAIGFEAAPSLGAFSNNTFIGAKAGYSAGTGVTFSHNVAIGVEALYSGAQAVNTVSVGNGALRSFSDNGGSYPSTAIGHNALYNASSGTGNTALGGFAGDILTTGGYNVFIGQNADAQSNSISNSIAIGSYAQVTGNNAILLVNNNNSASVTAAANQIVIGNSSNNNIKLNGATSTSVALAVGTSTSNGNGANLTQAGTWTNASDRRIKTNIELLDYGMAEILKMRPVQYKMIGTNVPQVGFIAQEIYDIVPEVVVRPDDEDGRWTMSYGNLTAVIVKGMQEQQAMIENQQAELSTLKAENAELRSRLDKIEEMLQRQPAAQ